MVTGYVLMVSYLSLGGATPFDATDEDEFSVRTESTIVAQDAAVGNSAGTKGEAKASLLGLLSSQWARRDAVLGTMEYVCILVIVFYLVAYIRGRRRSHQIATRYIRRVHGLFCDRFLEAGPASPTPPADRRKLLTRESPNTFLYYATGNRACDGVLVRISLANRHDIFLLAWSLLSPIKDTMTLEVALDDEDIEPMVFAVTRKRDVKRLLADVPHIQDYACVNRTSLIPPELACLTETTALMEILLPQASATLSAYPDLLELMHFTDQNEVPITGRLETPSRVLRLRFRMDSLEGAEKMVELALTYMEFLHRLVACARYRPCS